MAGKLNEEEGIGRRLLSMDTVQTVFFFSQAKCSTCVKLDYWIAWIVLIEVVLHGESLKESLWRLRLSHLI